jgi:hypothetical protein
VVGGTEGAECIIDGIYGIKDTYFLCKCVQKTVLEWGFNLPGGQ